VSEQVDAVVIGAGHNGLVAANLLADAGWDVVVCEATDVAGGAVRSSREIHPDFVTDIFSAFYPLSAASPILKALDLDQHGLQWSHAPHVLAHVLPDDRCAVLDRDVDVTAASLDQFAAGDGDAWRRIAAQWDDLEDAILGALFTPFPPVRSAATLLRRAGIGDALRLARLGLNSVRRFGKENFDGEGGPILFAGNALHSDLSPETAGSAVYGWLLCMLGQSVGFPVPVGGAGVLIDALVHRLDQAGGQLRLSTPVEAITLSHGRATGVRLRSGQTITARRAVLADVAAPILFEQLVGLEHLPTRFRDDLATFEWDAPTLKIDWALSSPIPWKSAEAGRAGTVHLGVDLDGLTRYTADLATKKVPKQPFVLLGQMTASDSSRSPAGTESAWAYTHLPAGIEYTDELVAEHVERVEALVERHAPGFRDRQLGSLRQSPDDLQHRNPNLVHGAVGGGTSQLHQQLVFRPVTGLGGADTPVRNLYLAGSSAHPGGGVHGAAGSNAARTALRNDSALGVVRRTAVRAAMKRIYR
jgi:phytoene dehydrogenase-like protein